MPILCVVYFHTAKIVAGQISILADLNGSKRLCRIDLVLVSLLNVVLSFNGVCFWFKVQNNDLIWNALHTVFISPYLPMSVWLIKIDVLLV